jgi:hypothetical protein
MKTIFLLLLCSITYAQQITEKWNEYEKRYEYFDSSGKMTAYKSYNPYEKQWEYFTVPQKTAYQPQSNVNIPLAKESMSSRQKAYDSNKQKIQSVIDGIYRSYDKIGIPNVEVMARSRFDKECIQVINAGKYDLSSNSKTDEIINWFYSRSAEIVKEELERYAKED